MKENGSSTSFPSNSPVADAAISAPTADTRSYAELRLELERAVLRVCPPWMADRRDDLVQNAVLRVMEIHRRSEGNRQLQASYLRKVAHSALVDEIRRLRRRRETPIETNEGEPLPLPAAMADPATRSLGHEIGRGIQDCLGRMVVPRARAVVLYLQGHTVPETGRLLGWTAKRVENLVYRGLADLRKCLDEKGLRP